MRSCPGRVVGGKVEEALVIAKAWKDRARTVWTDGSRLDNEKWGPRWCGVRRPILRRLGDQAGDTQNAPSDRHTTRGRRLQAGRGAATASATTRRYLTRSYTRR